MPVSKRVRIGGGESAVGGEGTPASTELGAGAPGVVVAESAAEGRERAVLLAALLTSLIPKG
jgi:hypothetical protein